MLGKSVSLLRIDVIVVPLSSVWWSLIDDIVDFTNNFVVIADRARRCLQ